MDLDRALDQISEIHAHVLRSEVFRGCRALPMAATGGIAIAAAFIMEALPAPGPAEAALRWIAVALLAGLVIGLDLLRSAAGAAADRRRLRTVVEQVVPCVAAGLVLAAVLIPAGGGLPALLPGLWTLLAGLGVLASRPYLPRTIGWVGLFYLAAGAALLTPVTAGAAVSPWAMGITFGLGQSGAALVIHRKVERPAS